MRGIINISSKQKNPLTRRYVIKYNLYLITHIKRVMKALFFRIGAIGDALLTTPAVRVFKETFPDCEVHYRRAGARPKYLKITLILTK
jgi:hypothetical protein